MHKQPNPYLDDYVRRLVELGVRPGEAAMRRKRLAEWLRDRPTDVAVIRVTPKRRNPVRFYVDV